MRFLGGFLKFLSSLIMIVATVVCILVSVDAAVVEAYLAMGLIWVCALLVSLNIWGTGIALTNISKLKKKNAQLEQKVENLLLAQVSAYRPAVYQEGKSEAMGEGSGEKISGAEVSGEKPIVAASPAAPVVENTPVSDKKNIKKWIPLMIIVGLCLLFLIIILVVVGMVKAKFNEQLQNPGIITGNGTSTNEQIVNKEESLMADAVSVELGGVIDNEFFTMSFEAMEIVDEYSFRTSEHSTQSLYVEDGYKLLMVKGLFVNNHTAVIKDSYFALAATVNETYVAGDYDVRLSFERSSSHEIDPYTEQAYVLYMNIPEKLAESFQTATFTIGFNNDLSTPEIVWDMNGNRTVEIDQNYSLTSDVSSVNSAGGEVVGPEAEAVSIAIGETIYTADYEFTLTNIEMSYEVLPSNPGSVYTSYPAASGKVYIDVEADVKNTMQRDIRIEELFTASAIYDGKYPYSGFTIVDDVNRFDWVGSYVAATPLETCLAHSLIECPVEVDTSGKPVVVYLELGDTVYEYILR